MEKLYIVSKTRPGADCGSDHELLIAKFRLKLKKVWKTTRPFRYRKKEKKVRSLNHVWLFVTPWTMASQAPSSMGFSRQEYWSGLSFYDLNQIPYDYTMEMRNRFKGIDLIYRVSEELWMEVHDIVQEAMIRPSPRKGNAKRQNGCLRRP